MCSIGTATAKNADFETKITQIMQLTDEKIALKQINQLLDLTSPKSEEYAFAINARGKIYFSLGELEDALSDFEQAQLFFHPQDLKLEEAGAYKMIGVMHYYLGNNYKALSAYQSSIAFYPPSVEPIKHANLLSNIGLVYAAIGNVSDAIKSYEEAETLFRAHGTEVDLVDVRHNIAGLYLRVKRFDISIDILKEVIAERNKFGDLKGLALAYGDLGAAYEDAGEYDLAQGYLLKSLNYYQKQDDLYNVASQFHNLAELYTQTGEIKKAQKYAKKAMSLSLQVGHKNAYAGSLFSYAKTMFYQKKYSEAFDYLTQSNITAEKIGYQDQLTMNLSLLSLINAAQGDAFEAVKNLHLYEIENNKASNLALNKEFARFESEKLKQQVMHLEKSKQFQMLEIEKVTQKRNFIIIAIFLMFLILFFVFRRNIERNSKLTLELQVQQRTQELECLMKELQHASRVKNQFLANMSHEIRTPLTAIMGQAEAIVAGDVEDEFVNKEVSIIHNNSLHLLDLINDILDLSKIEANKLELELKNQDLNIILVELNNIFKKQAKSKGLRFEINHVLNSPFIINTDSFRLKQILINLCSNAIKFTAKGSVKLDISVRKDDLIFKVADTGIGMDEIQLERLFESFTQGDSSISRRFGGTGLGLCLSEQLAKIMRGKIIAQSKINKGSVFTLILPYSDLSAETVEQGGLEGANQNQKHIFSGQILLAEDHDDNRRLISRLLTGLGLDVISARNGKEAVELFLQHDPELLLLDIQMPEMDGIEALKLLRKCGCSQPIIALTANAMAHEIEQYLSLGFDGHLKKPIERTIFIEEIAKYYDLKTSETEAYQALNILDMSDLVSEFKESLVEEHKSLTLLIKENDLTGLGLQAHKLSGAAQMFGFESLAATAKKLESYLKKENLAEIDKATSKLLDELKVILSKD